MEEGQDIGLLPWPHQRDSGRLWTSVLSLGLCDTPASWAEWWLSRSFLGVLGHLC